MKKKYDKRYVLSSVNNSLKILELLMSRKELSLNEITRITGMNKTSVYKILYTLEYRGFIRRTGTATYHISQKIQTYDSVSQQTLLNVSKNPLMSLWYKTGVTSILTVLNNSGKVVILLLKLDSNSSSIVGRIGAEMDWYSTAGGILLLSHCEKERQDQIIQNTLYQRYTEKTIIDPVKLKERLEEYKDKDSCIVIEENHIDHLDAGNLIFDEFGNAVGCIECIFEKEKHISIRSLQEEIQQACNLVSQALGYRKINNP